MGCLKQLSEESRMGLFSAIFTKNYFLWIGSGFSYNFGFGSWNDVLINISKKIDYELELDVTNPLKAAELLSCFAMQHHGYDEYKFNSLVAESLMELKKEIKGPDWVRKFILFSPNTIVTTNWDNQLESIFDYLSNVVVRKDRSPQVLNNGRNIFKIHGDVGRPSSIVVTQSQYFSFQREDTYLNRKIYTLFSEASPVFLGYSLTDPNISFLYDEVYAHLGEEKPPAYMIVHPSVSNKVLDESRLLFKGKNIHIIKAEIGEFLEDIFKEYKEYKNSAKRFLIEYKNIEERLREIITAIVGKKAVSSKKILNTFVNRDSRYQATSAFVEILSNQILYKEFGGELLSPENRISYREIDQIIGTIIFLGNENGYPNQATRDKFHASVMDVCAKSDGVWDFYSAREPFSNVLRISPGIDSVNFNSRIEHIIDVLRWSAPDQLGKCWATWDEFCKKINWLNEDDVNAIIKMLDVDGDKPYNPGDNVWLKKITKCKNCTNKQKKLIEEMIDDV
ncbi:SIR2 family NAD-dependent protein deacylase [Serratia sp. IR-2025]